VLRLERSGRVFAFATKSSDYDQAASAGIIGTVSTKATGTADVDAGGVQTASDVSWSDFELTVPAISVELHDGATTAQSCGSNMACSPALRSYSVASGDPQRMAWRNRAVVPVKHMQSINLYLCAGEADISNLRTPDGASAGIKYCNQNADARIQYTITDDSNNPNTYTPFPNSVCEAAGTAAVYDGPPTASAASSWRCDSSDYKNERTTSIWEASTYTGEKEQIPNTIASYQVTTKFVNLKAKAVKRNSDDSESISIIFAPTVDICGKSKGVAPNFFPCKFYPRAANLDTSTMDVVGTEVTAQIWTGLPSQFASIEGAEWGVPMTENGGMSVFGSPYGNRMKLMSMTSETAQYSSHWPSVPLDSPALTNSALSFSPAGLGFTANGFLIDMDFPDASNGAAFTVMQMVMGFPDAVSGDGPKACSFFKFEAKARATSSAEAGRTVATDFAALKASYAVVEQTDGKTWGCDLDANPTGCELDTSVASSGITEPINAFRSSFDTFQLVDGPTGGFPSLQSVRYTCLKADETDAGGSYPASGQSLSVRSWNFYGVYATAATVAADYPNAGSGAGSACDDAGTGDGIMDCGLVCRAGTTLGQVRTAPPLVITIVTRHRDGVLTGTATARSAMGPATRARARWRTSTAPPSSSTRWTARRAARRRRTPWGCAPL
jgi:hypothetical protein